MNKQEQGLTIAGKTYRSRLLVGSGKYRDLEQTREATEASGAEIITVAIRRVNIGQDPNAPSLLDVVPPTKYTILPNTAGCYNAEDAVYTLQLARELLNGHKLVKLEVLGNEKTLFPNMPETLKAAEILVKDGFDVMVYCSDDPVQAEDAGRYRLCRHHAAGIADRLRHGDSQSVESVADHRTVEGSGHRGCRRWHGFGCGYRHGVGL